MALRQDGPRDARDRLARRRSATPSSRPIARPSTSPISLEQNEFNGETYLELTIADLRPAAERRW